MAPKDEGIDPSLHDETPLQRNRLVDKGDKNVTRVKAEMPAKLAKEIARVEREKNQEK